MDAISILIQQSASCNSLLNLQDVATLHCVSHDVHVMINTYISSIPQNVSNMLETTAKELCIPNKPDLNHVVDVNALLRQLLIVRQLYGNIEKNTKLNCVLDNFTKNEVCNLWTISFEKMTKTNQIDTVQFLLQCIQKNCVQQNIIVIYILMSFLSRLFKNKKKDIHNKNESMFAYTNFRLVVVKKCLEITTTLREEITGYPYVFIDRTIRKIGEVKRITLSVS